MHASAAGKVILANMPPRQRDSVLSHLRLERFTEHTIVSPGTLRYDLADARKNGFAVCDREEFLQISGIAAPVLGCTGEVVAAISLWNVVERQDLTTLVKFADKLLSATRCLSARLGHNSKSSETS